ncbi:TonB-dependent receptor plug domain-containing protein [Roseateles sp.]|uniref:TonB-dependent receptor plug domain-containing protein n=1 Tax=Roseateles sp. TaxID=1971397 RepID=UPI003BA5E7BF
MNSSQQRSSNRQSAQSQAHQIAPLRPLWMALVAIWGGSFAAQAMAQSAPKAPSPAAVSAAASNPSADEQPQKLAPVQVSSNRQPASKFVLTGEELTRVAGTGGDPVRALQSLPGVVSTSDSNAAPAIRGSRPEDNTYYIDFLPVGYVYHLGGYFSVVHKDLVQQFDLYTGAFGPEFDDVHGGVVDITLRKPRTDRLGGVVNVGALGADVLVEGPVAQNQSFYFAAKRSYIDLIIRKDQTDKDSGVVYSMPSFSDYQAKYLWKLNPSNELTFHATGAADKLKLFRPADSDVAIQEPALAGTSRANLSSNTQAVVWDSVLSPQISNKLAIGHMDYVNKSKAGSAADLDLKQDSYFLRNQLRLRLGDSHDVTAGAVAFVNKLKLGLNLLDARCTEFEPDCDISSAPRKNLQDDLSINYTNLYLKDRWQLTPDFAATVGVHYTRDGYLKRNYTEPRLGLEWRALKNTVINAAWGKHNQFPDGIQVLKEFGNPKLGHVQSEQTVLGVTQRLSQGWSVKAEVYQKSFENFVLSDPTLNYINGGSGTSKGLELFVKKDLTDKLSGWLSVSLAETKRKNDVTGKEFKFEYDQPVVISLVGNYKYSDKWTYGAKWSYHSGNLITPVVGTRRDAGGRLRPVYGELNSERLPAYHRLDLRADWQYSKRASYYFELNNAYNRNNISGYEYTADYSKRKKVSELGLMPNVGFEYKF